MKLDLPPWTQNPFLVMPFFAVCIAVPLLIGMSDRAAEFAGGLSAALAAVVAVVLAGSYQRENDRARERRSAARRTNRGVRSMVLGLSWPEVLTENLIRDIESLQNPDTAEGHAKTIEDIHQSVRNAAPEIPRPLLEMGLELSDVMSAAITIYHINREALLAKFQPVPAKLEQNFTDQLLVFLKINLNAIKAINGSAELSRESLDDDLSA